MTEQERLDRETLLKRAAAAAGAAYASPVLTSAAAAAGRKVHGCTGQQCRRDRHCRRQGGPTCKCINGKCTPSPCRDDGRCGPMHTCELQTCGQGGGCECHVLAGTSGREMRCTRWCNACCFDGPFCDEKTGRGCPPGMCCYVMCCQRAVCLGPCNEFSD